MEFWDAYDKDMNKIDGVRLIRGLPIPEGMFHVVCTVIAKHTDGTYLLMQRDLKKTYPGLWEATAGGAAQMGETPLDCIKRELLEETGICAEHFTELGRIISEHSQSISFDFCCKVNCDKNSVRLQENETIAYQWVSEEDFLNMKSDYMFSHRMQEYVREARV